MGKIESSEELAKNIRLDAIEMTHISHGSHIASVLSVANIVAAQMTGTSRSEYSNDLGLSEEGIYAYCFECPRVAQSDSPAYINNYDNIFSIINPIDIVTKVAPDAWSYDRKGITYYLPSAEGTAIYGLYKYRMELEYQKILKKANLSDKYISEFLSTWPDKDQGTFLDKAVKTIANELRNPKVYVATYQDKVMDILSKLNSANSFDAIGDIISTLFSFPDGALVPALIHLPTTLRVLSITDNIKYAHYPELCLAWLDSLDGYTVTNYCSAKRYRSIIGDCPVDMNVYDSNGKLVASIINDEVQEIEDSTIGAIIDGDGQKVIILPCDEQYTVNISATDSGKMTYTVIEHDIGTGAEEKVVSYYELDIEKGDTFVGTVENLDITESAQYSLSKDGEPIVPTVVQIGDDIKEYSVNVTTEGSGSAIGGGIYVNGEFAMVTAEADKGEEFLGWYVDGVNVCTPKTPGSAGGSKELIAISLENKTPFDYTKIAAATAIEVKRRSLQRE